MCFVVYLDVNVAQRILFFCTKWSYASSLLRKNIRILYTPQAQTSQPAFKSPNTGAESAASSIKPNEEQQVGNVSVWACARACVFAWSVVSVCTRVDTMRAWQCKNESSFNLGKETDKRICLLSLHMWVRVSWRPFSGYARCRCRGWIKRRQRSNSN